MRFLDQIVPIFFLVQFLVMLAAMVTAMLRANPEVSPLRRRLAVARSLLRPLGPRNTPCLVPALDNYGRRPRLESAGWRIHCFPCMRP